MNIENYLVPLAYLLGAVQGIFLAAALFTSKAGNQRANRYLGALTLVFAAALIDYFLDFTQLINSIIELRTILWPKEFLYGPLLYFYVREMTRPGQFLLKEKQWLHFVPAFIHMAVTWPILFFSTERQLKILTGSNDLPAPDHFFNFLLGDLELYLTIFQLTIYFLLCFQLLHQHKHRIKLSFSYTDKISLNWLRALVFGTFIVYIIWLLEELISPSLQLQTVFGILLGGSMVILIYSMGYLALRQPTIFSSRVANNSELQPHRENNQIVDQLLPTAVNSSKYKNSPLTPEICVALLDDLHTLMENKKPYLDPKLSLPMLSESSGIPLSYLSQTINEHGGQNFFDFVNSYRIEEAKKRLSNLDDKKNILEIAMDVGFNSKSAFYSAFKKNTGMTPTVYRNNAGPEAA